MSDLSLANRATRSALLARIQARLSAPRDDARSASPATSFGESPRPAALAGAVAGSRSLKERFVRFALAGASTLEEVDAPAKVPVAVANYLSGQGLPLCAAIWSSLDGLDWISAGVKVAARPASGDDAVGITGVFCAIAETGTLLVLSGPGSAATTSLLPETHIAVVPVSRIVAGMEEAFALVLAERGELPRALNFISGPSRTGDIEQTIVLGAHGPSRVHLILLNDLV